MPVVPDNLYRLFGINNLAIASSGGAEKLDQLQILENPHQDFVARNGDSFLLNSLQRDDLFSLMLHRVKWAEIQARP